MPLDVQVTPTASCDNGKKEHRGRRKLLPPTGRQGAIWAFVLLQRPVVLTFHPLEVRACSAGETEGTSTRLGCDACSESS